MKLFTLLVVLMASMAAIEAAPMDEDPMGDFMENPEESMDYEADSVDKESMDEVGKVHLKWAKMMLA